MQDTMKRYATYLARQSQKAYEIKNERKMEQLAFFDSLTGMQNRACFDKDSAGMLPEEIAIIFIDANELKTFNDSYGHAAGDELLKVLADTICMVWSKEMSYRVGGDEFWIISRASPNELKGQVQDFRRILAEVRLHEHIVTAAVGIGYGAEGMTLEDVIRAADVDMYEDKRALKWALQNSVPTVGTMEESEAKENPINITFLSDLIKSGLGILALVVIFIFIN